MLFTFDGRSMLLTTLLTPDDPDVVTLGTLWLALVNAPVKPTDDGDSIPELVTSIPCRYRGAGGVLDPDSPRCAVQRHRRVLACCHVRLGQGVGLGAVHVGAGW